MNMRNRARIKKVSVADQNSIASFSKCRFFSLWAHGIEAGVVIDREWETERKKSAHNIFYLLNKGSYTTEKFINMYFGTCFTKICRRAIARQMRFSRRYLFFSFSHSLFLPDESFFLPFYTMLSHFIRQSFSKKMFNASVEFLSLNYYKELALVGFSSFLSNFILQTKNAG